MSPEESSYGDELNHRLESLEETVTQLALGQLEPTGSILIALVRLIQETRRFARQIRT